MKKIVVVLITLAMVFSLSACGHSNKDTTKADNDSKSVVVYLKWTDGEELLENVKYVNYANNRAIWITLEDGTTIMTGYANVIIVEK